MCKPFAFAHFLCPKAIRRGIQWQVTLEMAPARRMPVFTIF